MRSQARSAAIGAFMGLFILCLPFLFSDSQLGSRRRPNPRDIYKRDLFQEEQFDISAIDMTNATGGHGFTQSTTPWSVFATSHSPSSLHSLERRGDGPLYCTDTPCIDGSCCGPAGICGYGPDFCGDGCTSQCNATAMCGQYSEDADMPCGMKLCCSATGWCGTTEDYCGNADPLHGTLPCQAGYGSCAITGPPSCASGSGSSAKRKIGYYQSWNVRDRKCNKVSPDQLNTDGYTHLFFSFASMDPVTFRIAPAHPGDVQLMKDFTALSKEGKLQTWIAVGGFDFSNPESTTHTTWSDMVSTKTNRAAFINSTKEYMDTYGFQGVDLDWEYPGAPERGGKKLADTRNLSLLVKEMRTAFGTAYGISVTLAPDYWYLRWFDAKAMEANVDFFGFMAYDLHGSWDADVKTLGSLVRGQADIREISKNTLPLWFDGLNPAKLNFGLAMYGRGYTLSDPACNQLLCPFSGPSKPAQCTAFNGVMSLVEIKALIKERGIEPQYIEEVMMKQITWDDQWIGYDDEDTFAAKMDFADSLCFGGTMVWSIDFQEIGSGGPEDEDGDQGEIVYIGTEVFQQPTAQCSAPCVMVLPPSKLPSTTTISLPKYTTSVEVGSSTMVNGVTSFVVTTTTVTLTLTPIVTDEFPMYNVPVSSGQSSGGSIVAVPSVSVPPTSIVLTNGDGQTSTRVLTLPPWPAVTRGPIETGSGGTSGGSSDDGSPVTFTIPPESPYTKPAIYANCAHSTVYVAEVGAVITLQDCQGVTTMDWNCPATKTVEIEAATTVNFELGCTAWKGTGYSAVPTGTAGGDTGTTSTISGLPLYATWPAGELIWVEDEPEDNNDDKTTTCNLWFFFICISWGDIKIGGWKWDFPPGILPPGPPPTIKFPPSFSIKGNLPGPWPRITIGKNGVATYPTEKPTDCTSSTAEVCITTTSFSATVTGRTTQTATSVVSTCTPVVGCNVEDDDTTTSVTTRAGCTASTYLGRRTVVAAVPAEATAVSEKSHELDARAGPYDGKCVYDDVILYPKNPTNGDEVDSLVEGLGYFSRHGGDAEPGSDDALSTGIKYGYGGGFMAYIFLKEVKVSILPSLIRELNFRRSLVKDAYGIFTYNDEGNYQGTTADASTSSRSIIDEEDIVEGHQDDLQLSKRAERQSNYWELSQMSVPPGVAWSKSATLPGGPFTESYDTSFGRGQVIYVVEDDFVDDAEFALTYHSPDGGTVTRSAVHKIPMGENEDFGDIHRGAAKTKHGSEVLSKVWGVNLGLAKNAQIILPLNANGDPTERRNKIQDLYLNSLVRVLQDIDDNYEGRESDCIINMSFGWMAEEMDYMHPAHYETLYQLLKEFDNRGVVLVAVSHNYDLKPFGRGRLDGWPSRFGNPGAPAAESLPNLIVVSGIDQNTRVSPVNPYERWLVTAPGWDVNVPGGGTADGASLAAPLVAGVIAYWRGLPNMKQRWKDELRDPANVKKLVRFMQRNIPSPGIDVNRGGQPRLDKPQVPFIWTGRVKDGDCLVDPTLKGCPVFTESLADLEEFGSMACGSGASKARKRQDGGQVCVVNPGGNGGSGQGPNQDGFTISYKPGPVSPTCTSGCGTSCSGYFCEPTPTGKPPGYYDPLDPDHPFLSDLPTLAPTPTATSCASTEKTTSTVMCAGGNGHSACVTRQVCTKTSEATVEPTPTRPPKDSGMTCYRDNNADGKWKTFTFAEGEAMYASTCDSGLQLITNGQGFIGGGGDDDNGLRMAFRWADDQSGCKGKQAFDLDKPCHQGFAAINDQCDAGYDSSYGGTYRMQTDYGCVQVSLGRSDTG